MLCLRHKERLRDMLRRCIVIWISYDCNGKMSVNVAAIIAPTSCSVLFNLSIDFEHLGLGISVDLPWFIWTCIAIWISGGGWSEGAGQGRREWSGCSKWSYLECCCGIPRSSLAEHSKLPKYWRRALTCTSSWCSCWRGSSRCTCCLHCGEYPSEPIKVKCMTVYLAPRFSTVSS